MAGLQRAIALLYPDQCAACSEPVEGRAALCASCWREMPFIFGLACDLCGVPLPGEGDGTVAHCDDCLARRPPWSAGVAALGYRGTGQRMVLALKHGDRTDIAPLAADWMARAGARLLLADVLLVPIPIHWTRLLKRKYNQSAELARALGRKAGLETAPQALTRTRRTPPQDGLSVDGRFMNLDDAITAHARHGRALRGRRVCLIDDVMTSGATLTAATEAAYAAGARQVSILALARAAKAP